MLIESKPHKGKTEVILELYIDQTVAKGNLIIPLRLTIKIKQYQPSEETILPQNKHLSP